MRPRAAWWTGPLLAAGQDSHSGTTTAELLTGRLRDCSRLDALTSTRSRASRHRWSEGCRRGSAGGCPTLGSSTRAPPCADTPEAP